MNEVVKMRGRVYQQSCGLHAVDKLFAMHCESMNACVVCVGQPHADIFELIKSCCRYMHHRQAILRCFLIAFLLLHTLLIAPVCLAHSDDPVLQSGPRVSLMRLFPMFHLIVSPLMLQVSPLLPLILTMKSSSSAINIAPCSTLAYWKLFTKMSFCQVGHAYNGFNYKEQHSLTFHFQAPCRSR